MSTTTRVSVASDGTQGNESSYSSVISNNGSAIAFESYASNLVEGDTNQVTDIFFHDVQSGTTQLVSAASDGTQGNDASHNPAVSGDGGYVVFESYASNLVGEDSNNTQDIFVRDLQTGVTKRVNLSSNGTQANGYSHSPQISGNGRYITFASSASNLVEGDTNNATDIFVYDQETGTTSRVSVTSDNGQSNNSSDHPVISEDGRYIVFASSASNLVEGDTNNSQDIFVHDRETGLTKRVSVASDGTQATGSSDNAAISGNGRYVVFVSDANDLTQPSDGESSIFVHDLETGQTKEIPGLYTWYYTSNNPEISDDGRYVTYESELIGLGINQEVNGIWGVYVYDTLRNQTIPVLESDSYATSAYYPAISGDGNYITFSSYVNDLVPGDTNNALDVFVVPQPTNDFTYTLSVNPMSATEGHNGTKLVTYTVTRSGNIVNPSEINYTLSGTATNGEDYNTVANSGTLTFYEEQVSQSLTIEVRGDTLTETDETIILTLSDGNSTTTTIVNDDFTLNGTSGNDLLIGCEQLEMINGFAGRDSLHGNEGNDTMYGGDGNDLLNGGSEHDYLDGGKGQDVLIGSSGNDTLVGGVGNDTLSGGVGYDRFRFYSRNEGTDKIQDFNPMEDKIEISATGFGLSRGTIKASQFVVGSVAGDSSDRFGYNRNSGDLFFDPDGGGAISAVKLVNLGTSLNLTNSQIVVV